MSYENLVQAQLSAPIEATAVTLTLAAAESPYRLPPADGGVLVLADSLGKPTFVEIIRYASRDGQTLLGLERGIEGTTAFAWNTGDYCYQSLTAGEFKRSSLWANQSADLTADAGSRNNLTASITVSLPANPSLGDTVEFIKLVGVTPLIQTTDGTPIQVKDQSDTSVLYNYEARLLAVFNGTAWEI
jgi:hypothetical protein|tara:strand:- start:280 stop:840 length:561 start_codon:yes stop_codon:yes gene_type:complete